MDLKLDTNPDSPSYGDLVYENGACPVVSEGREDLAQRLRIKLLTYLSEWFLNQDVGVPYYQAIFGKQRSKAAVDIIFQEQILSEPDAVELVEFNSSLDRATRQYSLSFRVRTDEGVTDEITINI